MTPLLCESGALFSAIASFIVQRDGPNLLATCRAAAKVLRAFALELRQEPEYAVVSAAFGALRELTEVLFTRAGQLVSDESKSGRKSELLQALVEASLAAREACSTARADSSTAPPTTVFLSSPTSCGWDAHELGPGLGLSDDPARCNRADDFEPSETSRSVKVSAAIGKKLLDEGELLIQTQPGSIRIGAEHVKSWVFATWSASEGADATLATDGEEAAGRVVLLSHGDGSLVEKARAAERAGAVGVIVANDDRGNPRHVLQSRLTHVNNCGHAELGDDHGSIRIGLGELDSHISWASWSSPLGVTGSLVVAEPYNAHVEGYEDVTLSNQGDIKGNVVLIGRGHVPYFTKAAAAEAAGAVGVIIVNNNEAEPDAIEEDMPHPEEDADVWTCLDIPVVMISYNQGLRARELDTGAAVVLEGRSGLEVHPRSGYPTVSLGALVINL